MIRRSALSWLALLVACGTHPAPVEPAGPVATVAIPTASASSSAIAAPLPPPTGPRSYRVVTGGLAQVSTDGGATWSPLKTDSDGSLDFIAAAPSNPDVVYAVAVIQPDCSHLPPNADCVWGHAELHGTLDGVHWSKLADIPPAYGIPEKLSADTTSVTLTANHTAYVTHDRGKTWAPARGGCTTNADCVAYPGCCGGILTCGTRADAKQQQDLCACCVSCAAGAPLPPPITCACVAGVCAKH